MEKKSKPNSFVEKVAFYTRSGIYSERIASLITEFYRSFREAVENNYPSFGPYESLMSDFADLVAKQIQSPYPFSPYHAAVKEPYDYHAFGLNFFGPLVNFKKSSIMGLENLLKVKEQLKKGENVIFLANHQIEGDPLVLMLLFEPYLQELAHEMIFVAGERVLTDPIGTPFSMGCNLLCIYSRRYIDKPPERKHEKQVHNQKTMRRMGELLAEGGKCIYVAPSGGRDRKNKDGVIEVAPFDPDSIELFYLMARHAKTPTHFYTLALSTYDILPPPPTIQVELGELRVAGYGPIHAAVGKEIDMEGVASGDKHLQRKGRADYIYQQVCQDYQNLPLSS